AFHASETTGIRIPCSSKASTSRRHVVRPSGGAVPAPGALLRGWCHEAVRGRAVPAAAAGLRGAEAHRRRLAGVAALLRRLRAVVLEGRAAVPGARASRRGSHRGPLEPAIPVA